ncbi:SOS response-associated peptidase [Chitiniphilus eburneus]|uniref:Abasic site processing protein n=1 Tax=Chitiniphilus eburneus TaxID=2571148 RepID=A0A4U0Q7G8_9NEIS|nr:SOS response-associated peptidase family protein [Chitiniphilus eburneus]TJZ76222.1 SOS response-associated peptidase [Chitiniphilus eburneus]
MCVNFLPPAKRTLADHFRVMEPDEAWPEETWQGYAAPILVDVGQGPQVMVGSYGMVPRGKMPAGARPYATMNARAETVGEKRAFRGAWRVGQLCLVPMLGFFEPSYESGRPVRWRIGAADDAPFAVAGLWRAWDEPDGTLSHSFTQLTINADTHPVMRRFHAPGDEKRSLVVVPEHDYELWLTCRNPELARTLLRPCPDDFLHAVPAPLPRRGAQSAGDLFGNPD